MKNNKVRKAIIPIAGNGTRMFPETFFIKKVMLPVMDRDGAVKPALLFMLEELAGAGIEEIYLIVGDGEEEDYNRIFNFEFDEEYAGKLPEKYRKYYSEIHELGKRIHTVVQKEKKGFGHAVYQAFEYLEGEPCVMLLGDFLYRSETERSCTQQLIDAYDLCGKALVGIKKIPIEDSPNYGIVHGKFRTGTNILDSDTMVEKPDIAYSERNLLVDGFCYATFGNYLLTEDVFLHLGEVIKVKERNKDLRETDLTGSLKNAAEKGSLAGVDIRGKSFDVGLPDMYYRTFTEFREG